MCKKLIEFLLRFFLTSDNVKVYIYSVTYNNKQLCPRYVPGHWIFKPESIRMKSSFHCPLIRQLCLNERQVCRRT